MSSLVGGTPPLDPGEVQVWVVPATGGARVAARLAASLSADELERASRMRDPDAFVIGRAGVRAILARFTSVPAGTLEIVAGRGSRPRLVQGPEWLDFSFSRCDEVHVCALTIRRRIGIDLQIESPAATVRTQKDALTKAVGAALAPPPDTIETLGDPGNAEAAADERGGRYGRLRLPGPLDRDDWHVATFVPVVGVAGAVVAEGEWTLTLATWAGVG